MPLDREKISKNLKNKISVRVFGSIDSTNNEAKRNALNDKGAAVLYAAESQTSGRGRRGHSFFSPEGGLYMTLSLPVNGIPESIGRLTCSAAVAVCGALSELAGIKAGIKWINDIYVDGRKAAGILCELVSDKENRSVSVIIGIGVNLTTESFPDDIAEKAGRVGDIDPSVLCAAVADELIERYRTPDNDSFLEKYISLSTVIGKRISYSDAEGEHTAVALTVDRDCSLVIRENNEIKKLSSGEISVRLE